jgi:hypothetical protein
MGSTQMVEIDAEVLVDKDWKPCRVIVRPGALRVGSEWGTSVQIIPTSRTGLFADMAAAARLMFVRKATCHVDRFAVDHGGANALINPEWPDDAFQLRLREQRKPDFSDVKRIWRDSGY